MKKFITTALVACIAFVGFTQSTYKESIKFSYEQPSLHYLNAERNYTCELIMNYEEDVVAKRTEIETENEKRKAAAAKELADYNAKTTGTKIAENLLLNEKKPTGVAVLKPMPFFQKVYDKEPFLEKFLTIAGLEKDKNAQSKVVITIDALASHVSKKEVKEKGFLHTAYVELAINAKVYNNAGELILDKTEKNSSKVYKSGYSSTATVNNNAWKKIKKSKLAELEKDAINKNMTYIRRHLTKMIGYPTLENKSNIFMVKAKKFKYDEINGVYPVISEAYALTIDKDQDENRHSKIKEAIAVWETALKDQDLNDKKARINAKVAAALHLNIAEAYLWLNDYSQARQHLAKHKVIDAKGFNRDYKNLDADVIDHKKRFEANNI